MLNSRTIKIIIATVLLFQAAGVLYAADDNFGPAKKTESAYFTIYSPVEADENSLARKLNVGLAQGVLSGEAGGGQNPPTYADLEFRSMLDALFLDVSGMLDMRINSFTANIKICRDENQLKEIYSILFENAEFGDKCSFYLYSTNTIYVSSEHVAKEILGPEIARAIISRYFLVQPPAKVQDLLINFVETQLRKDATSQALDKSIQKSIAP